MLRPIAAHEVCVACQKKPSYERKLCALSLFTILFSCAILLTVGTLKKLTWGSQIMSKKLYFVIAQVNGKDFLTKVHANSFWSAEQLILDESVCGMHTYGVTACNAYDESTMKYEAFYMNALKAEPIGFEMLVDIIKKRNAEIIAKDKAEKRIEEIEKQMKQLQDELEMNKKIFEGD